MATSFSEDEVRAILEATSGDFAGSTLSEHAQAAFQCLRRTIPHTSLNVFLVRSGVPTPVCTTGLIDERGLRDYVGHYIHTDPMRTTFGDLASVASTLKGCARRDGVDLRRNEFLQDYALPRYRIGDLLGSNALIDENVIFTFALHREPILPPFDERDQVALKLALGPLARSLRVTYARERALEVLRSVGGDGMTRADHETVGVALLDGDLNVVEISPVAQRVLRDLESSSELDDVLAIAATLVDRLGKSVDRTTCEASIVRRLDSNSPSVERSSVSIRVVATRAASGRAIIVYLFIDVMRSRTELLVSRVAHPYGLSPREVEITSLLQEGHNLTAIARRLGVRPQTVRASLLGIRKKLGVKTNAQILLRLLAGA